MANEYPPSVEKTLNEADQVLIKLFNEHLTPGLAVGIIYDGKLVYTKSMGYANLETCKPVTNDTVFRIMSISKTFTTLAIMQLWEQGKLDLDDPVNLHLKGLKVQHKDPAAPPVRIQHMLTHLAGIGETRSLWDLTRPVAGLAARPNSRILSMPEYYNGLLRAEIYPGGKWSYSNHAFGVLAYLIECVSGEPFDQYMRKHVFEPLGMFKTDYVLSERVRGELAQGYTWKKSAFKPYPYLRLNTPGCGGIFSSVNEMAKYTAAMMNGGANEHGRVIKAETLQRMMTPQFQTGVFNMGLGFFLEKIGDHWVTEHSGGWPGFISSMRVMPDQKLAMVAFTNCSADTTEYATKDLLHRLVGLETPFEKPKSNPVLQHPEVWSELTGSYGPKQGFLTNFRYWGGMAGETEVYVKDGKLMLRSFASHEKKGLVLENCDPRNPLRFITYRGTYPVEVLFERDERGNIKLMMHNYVLYKKPNQKSMQFMLNTAIGALAGAGLAVLLARLIKRRR